MNRGFAFYFKNAIKSSFATVWKNKNILQVTAYFLAELAARLTLLFSALFDLADVRQGKIADESGRMDIPQTLRVSTKSKPVWTMVVSIIAEAFIFLGGALIIAAITAILALIGYAVVFACNGPLYVIAIVCAPGGLLFLAYAVLFGLIFSPTPYIIETNPDIGVAETVKICLDTMKGRGKITAFLNFFIPTLAELIILGLCGAGAFLIHTFVGGVAGVIVLAVWLIFSIALCVLTLPTIDLVKKIAQKSLFEDIVLDPVNAGKRTAGINIKMCEGVKFEPSAVKGNLVALFDETQSDSVPSPDSPARKKIKEKAEKAAKKKQEEGAKAAEEKAEVAPAESAEDKKTEQPAPVKAQKAQPEPASPQPEPAKAQTEAPQYREPATPQYTEPQQNYGNQQGYEQPYDNGQYADNQQGYGQQYADPSQGYGQQYDNQQYNQQYADPSQGYDPMQDYNIAQGDDGFNDAGYDDGYGNGQYSDGQYADGYGYEQPQEPPAQPAAEEKPKKKRGLFGKK